jgi:outer membrane protein
MRAYQASPVINSRRAGLRAIDEKAPQALAGMRPRVASEALLGVQSRRNVQTSIEFDDNDPTTRKLVESHQTGAGVPRGASVTIEQPLFDGFKTQIATRAAETGVFAGRERLRLTEQRVLFDAVSAYMNVLRDTAALKLQQNNVAVLAEQLRQNKERYLAGQITLTDIAQSEARLAGGRSQVGAAQAALDASIGVYRQIVGEEPKRLAPASPVDRLLPKTRDDAERIAQSEHPVILAALHDADAADLDIRVIESDFMPRLSVIGNVFTQTDIDGRTNRSLGASMLGKLSMPIYQGGETSSRVREAKEIAGQRKLDVDVAQLGRAASRQGPDRGRTGASQRGGARALRRARRGQGGPAHDARNSECAAGAAERPHRLDRRSTRSRGRVIRGARRHRAPVDDGARPRLDSL